MKLIWLSDLHLEFVDSFRLRLLLDEIADKNPDAILITGDISNARLLEYHLTLLAESLNCPIYFVLGNHDFYQGSFAQVDALVASLCHRHPNLIELGHGEVVPLGNNTLLIGHRGWADGRAGKGRRSTVRLNDHQYIIDLRLPDSFQLFEELSRLGNVSAEYIRQLAPQAIQEGKSLIIATHVPPFVEAALYENKPSSPDFAPHFVNMEMGRAIREMAQKFPQTNIGVLCGHTHHAATINPLPNLLVQVAPANYHNPTIAGELDI